jgi:hypothetical protein
LRAASTNSASVRSDILYTTYVSLPKSRSAPTILVPPGKKNEREKRGMEIFYSKKAKSSTWVAH